MELLRPEIGTGDFQTSATIIQYMILLGFKKNSPILNELIIEDIIDPNGN